VDVKTKEKNNYCVENINNILYYNNSVVLMIVIQNKPHIKQPKHSRIRRSKNNHLPLICPVYSFSQPTLINTISQHLVIDNDDIYETKVEKKQHFLPAIISYPQVPPPDCKELFNKYNECIREPELYSIQHHNKCIQILENSVFCEHKPK
jgi:hypothetical protein